MSTSYETQLFVGAYIQTSTLFTETGVEWRCFRDHPRPDGESWAHCPRCGAGYTSRVTYRAPTEAFVAFAESQGETAEGLWEDWLDGEAAEDCLGLSGCQPSSEAQDHFDECRILGFNIVSVSSHAGGANTQRSFTLEDLDRYVQQVRELLDQLGLHKHPVRIVPILDIG